MAGWEKVDHSIFLNTLCMQIWLQRDACRVSSVFCQIQSAITARYHDNTFPSPVRVLTTVLLAIVARAV